MAATSRRSVRIAWLVCGVALALMAIAAGIQIATWSVSLESVAPRGSPLLVYPVVVVVGAVITSRVPTNAIGYVFLGAGVVGALQCLSEQVAFAAVAQPGLAPLGPWAGLAYAALAMTNTLLAVLFIPALFPSGRLVAERDRRALLVGCAAVAIAIASGFTVIDRIFAPFMMTNPLARPELGGVAVILSVAAACVYLAALGIVLGGLVQRFRRSGDIERQQLKWFAYGASITALVHGFGLVLGAIVFFRTGQQISDVPPVELRAWVLASISSFAIPPIAVAIAILRYRLYDIDILINRTVLYVSVTAILAALFAVLSAASQRVMETLTGQRSDLVTIAVVVAVALGFAPLRRRIQPLVDRVLPGRGVLTLLFTDIVGSTERIVAIGDERWNALLEAYRAAVRRELARFGGREIDTAGDGFFAAFERPAQAVRCAAALRNSLRELGLDSRIGLHTGECELRGERVSGLNVHVAARIMAAAKANEIVASSALRDLVDGAGFRFREGRVESLKGVPGEWRLNLVDDASMPAVS